MGKEERIYYDSGLSCINPERLSYLEGTIVRSLYTEIPLPNLEVTVRTNSRDLCGSINITGCDPGGDLSDSEFIDSAVKSVARVYSGFDVKDSSELVGKTVKVVVFNGQVPVGFGRG